MKELKMRLMFSLVASIIFVAVAALPALYAAGQETAGSVAVTLVADADGDGQVSDGDEPAFTRVSLHSPERPLVGVYTDASGSFELRNIPEGSYTLTVWWSPGFIPPATTVPTNPGRLDILFDVTADGTIVAATPLPEVILVQPLPEGLIPFPTGGPAAIPTGVIDVAAAYAAAAPTPAPPVDLPPAGVSASRSADAPMGHFVLVAATLVAGLAAVTWGRRHA
jgi:hypothetical protein